MSDFKPGDVVVCIKDYFDSNDLPMLGEKYIVEDVFGDAMKLIGIEYFWCSSCFKLDNTTENVNHVGKKEFCMKRNPWFIKIDNNESKYNLVIDFLKNKGFYTFKCQENFESNFKFLTNKVNYNEIIRIDRKELLNSLAKEIRIDFEEKIQIKSVTYPNIKSEKELEIEKIEEEMRKLAERLNKIKGD